MSKATTLKQDWEVYLPIVTKRFENYQADDKDRVIEMIKAGFYSGASSSALAAAENMSTKEALRDVLLGRVAELEQYMIETGELEDF